MVTSTPQNAIRRLSIAEESMITSKLCTKADFDTAWFMPWRRFMTGQYANDIQLGGVFLHRKEWEFIAVAQALHERGMLRTGMRGLGFAVGMEPLPALYASLGCEITATDHFDDADGAWQGQWAVDKMTLNMPDICPASTFLQKVELRRVDMRAIPTELSLYDFSWSCCALEHLGTLQKGMDFLEAQMACLKPGGVAAHTTEFNLLSDTSTIVEGSTVVYRMQDLNRLICRLQELGHTVEPLDLNLGDSMEDWFVAHPPWSDLSKNLAHLRVLVERQICTSVLLIIRKRKG